jgi:hypothetical protein
MWQLALSLPILFVSHLLWQYVQSPLKNIPGPFFAKFTNIWRLLDILGGRSDLTQKILHAKHGSAVRLGPNFVTLSDPSLIKVVYDARGKFLKVSCFRDQPVKPKPLWLRTMVLLRAISMLPMTSSAKGNCYRIYSTRGIMNITICYENQFKNTLP